MKNYRKIFILGVLFFGLSHLLFNGVVNARGKSKGRNARTVSSVAQPKVPNIEVEQPKVDKVKELIGIPSYLLNSESCELFYTMCMNKYCIQDDEKGACSCTPSAVRMSKGNGMDKFYDIDGDMVKEGIELLQYSEGYCGAILENCSGMELAVKNSYNITSQSDCIGWVAKNPEIEPSMYDELMALEKCMKPVCKGDGKLPEDIPFVKCFNLDEAEILLNECSHVIASSPNVLSLKEYFVKSMRVKMQDMCANLGHASEASDQYGCNVKVSYGVNSENPIKEMAFKMGDVIMCSQEYFGTETPIVKSIAKANAKKMKNRAIADTVSAGVNMVAAVANVATPPDGGASSKVGQALEKVADSQAFQASMQTLDKVATVATAASVATNVAATATSNSKNEKVKSTMGDVNSGVGAVAGGLSAGGALSTVSAVGDIVAQAGAITSGVADIKKYSAQQKLSLEVNAKGSCWVNGQMVAQEGQVLTLMWNDFYKY